MAAATDKQINVFTGVFQDGIIVPEKPLALPNGTAVTITLPHHELPPELREEFADWDRAGGEAWKMLDEWERETGENPQTLA